MPTQMIFALGIELVLVAAAVFLFFYQPGSDRVRGALRVLGGVFVCAVFCWSVILGSVYALYRMSQPLGG